MLLREAKQILRKNGYRLIESIEPEEMFLNKVKLELLNDSNFIKMFDEDEIDSYIEKYHDGLIEYMIEDPEGYGMAASWLKEMIYEE